MKKHNKKMLVVLLVIIGIIILTGCQRNTDANGVTLAEKIISLDTPWRTAMEEGVLSAIFVWPLAQAINWVASIVNSSVGSVIIVTILFTIITLPMTVKSTISTQRMQMMQPEMARIQAKYEGKNDNNSRMMQSQELQMLYSKNNINPLGTIITPFLQFPIMIAMYYAVQRAEAVCTGTFAGMPLSTTPKAAIKMFSTAWPVLLVFVLMIAAQFFSMKIPQWIAAKKKKSAKNYKAYADQGNPQAASNNMMSISMVALIAFIGYSWPIAMSFYWLVNSIANTAKTMFIQWRFIDHA